jgi:DNA polymerase III subunit chi
MTRIDFYTNVTDKAGLTASLLAEALQKQRQATLHVENEVAAQRISDYLWQNINTSFLPNMSENHSLAKETPVVIDWQSTQLLQDDLLINLQDKQPLFFSRFKQLVEIVGLDETEKINARERFKFYRDRGYEIKHIDFAKQV